MSTEFDGAALDRWLLREADQHWGGKEEEKEPSATCDYCRESLADQETISSYGRTLCEDCYGGKD